MRSFEAKTSSTVSVVDERTASPVSPNVAIDEAKDVASDMACEFN